MSIHWEVQAQMDDDYTVAYEKHLQEQLKKFKDVAQAELEAMVLASREVEEKEKKEQESTRNINRSKPPDAHSEDDVQSNMSNMLDVILRNEVKKN